ncbi:MAG: T9SS type A sorting domain-containing protein [Flavobacteriales bacterium]|nr:T9SS type A sorting domain-containing protein [Flavobacteriales bacterium]
MKKILLSLAVVATGFAAQSQVICAGISPAAIQGNYDFTWGDPAGGDWSTPDFLIPNTFVQDTLAVVDDGSTGTNPQGNPVSAEGCNPLVNGVDVNGKIAVIYRNTCEFGAKALNAQNAGAVGVIIINRDPEVIEMGGGADGASVTIPVVMISSTDGLTITNEMANGPVVMFLGNKTGLYPNDAGVTSGTSLWSKSSGVLSQLAQNGSEFNFDVATRIYNYGTDDQTSASVTATVDGPSGNVYTETVNLPTILSGDSVDVEPGGALSFPQFSLTSYPAGEYTVSYSVDLGIADDYDADNTVSSSFYVQDSIFGFSPFDANGLPVQNNGFRPGTNNSTFSNCIVFDNPNGSRVGVTGLYFQALGSSVDLSGEEISLYAYRWEDVFTDLNDPAMAFNSLNPIANGFYYFPSDLQGETVYGAFNTPVLMEDNQRFLLCAQTVNLDVFLGFNDGTDYTRNVDYYLQPLAPIENDGAYFAVGFGSDIMSSVGAKMVDAASIGLDENGTIEGSAYPNPAKDIVTIEIETTEDATIVVTDLSGKIVLNDALSFANGNATVNIADLESGMYVFNITLANGLSSQFSVAKN